MGLLSIVVSCLILCAFPTWADSSETTFASSVTAYHIRLKPADLQKFGLYYPVTYKFRLPSGIDGLAAQYRYGADETWLNLPEKKEGELFNGIEAVRFDYGGGFGYASIRFSRLSENIYLRFTDSAGQAVAVQFESIPRYYDGRKAAVTVSLDDWTSWSDTSFRAASDYLGSYGLFFTVGLIADSVPWSSVQQKIDQHRDQIEIASHGTYHSCSAAEYAKNGYQAEIIGSRDAIRTNLKYGSSPYVSVYLEPCSYNDVFINNWVSAGDYLLSRSAGYIYTAPFAAWSPLLGRYGHGAITFATSGRPDDVNLLNSANAAFDHALAAGTIYHLTDHPEQGLWRDNSNLLQHLSYIKGRSDIWYVPFGPYYQYHYVQEKRGDISIQDLDNPSWAASFTASPSSGRAPLSVSFNDTTGGTNSGWQWDFGDSTSSNEQNPLHVFASAGSYAVKLTVTGPSGISTTTALIQVSPPPVELVFPSTGTVFAAQSAIPITATASADQGAMISKVEFFSGTSLLGTATTAPYSFLWSGIGAGNYSLTAIAIATDGVSKTSRPVTISVVNSTLPSPWISKDIGSVGIPGSSAFQNGTLTISGAGSDIWGSSDSFHFVFQPMTGDGQIVARIAALQNTDPSAKGGVMMREALTAGSAYAMMAISPGKPANFQRRLETDAFYIATEGTRPAASTPYWVKLVRSGNVFSGYISADGTNWAMVNSEMIEMAATVYVGLPVTSHVYGTLCTALIDEISISSAAVTSPTVNITAPASGAVFTAPANIPITATAAAFEGISVTRVEFYNGPYLLETRTSSPYSMTWSNVPVGNYTITARVTDSLGASTTSSPVEIGVVEFRSPAISITAPANGASFNAYDNVPIAVAASAGTGATIARVEFYNGSSMIGTAIASPYSFSWNNIPAGSYTLSAKVVDSLGATATSTPVEINVLGSSLPVPWVTMDIGSVGLTGSGSYQGGTFTVSGAGWDIWGNGDSFRYVYQPFTGDGQIIARVVTLQNTDPSAKGGLMVRGALTADSAYAMITLSPGKAANFQRRLNTGAGFVTTKGYRPNITAPYWLKLVRSGNVFSGYVSVDGSSWLKVDSDTISLPGTVYIGMAVTSHDPAKLCTATFDSVSVTAGTINPPAVSISSPASGSTFNASSSIMITAAATAGSGATISQVDFYADNRLLGSATTSPYTFSWDNVPAGVYSLTATGTDSLGAKSSSTPVAVTVIATTLPAPWSSQDIGSVGVTGSAGFENGTFTVSGAGYDIWGTTDAFRYVFQSMTGDGEIVARVASIQNTDVSAKSGVMIRETLTANAAYAMMALSPGKAANFQRRLITGADYIPTQGYRPNVTAPYWVKLVRSGNTFSGYVSADGLTWLLVGSDTINLPATVYIGVAVTSHDATKLCTATFDGVSVTTGSVSSPTVAISSPVNGSSFSASSNITITTSATAGSGAAISQVDFYSGNMLLGSTTTSPYNFTWNNVPAGEYTLTATVTNSFGAKTNSAPVTIVVVNNSLPSPWMTQDIGSVGATGKADFQDGTFTISGAGYDIWGTSDAFRYMYQPMTGDGQIIARVASIQNSDPSAKSGVMIREALTTDSAYAMMALSPGKAADFQRRLSSGAFYISTPIAARPNVTPPYWVKLVRNGNTFSGYVSPDGASWVLVGSDTVGMSSSVYIGIPVTSHLYGTLCMAAIDGVAVSPGVSFP